MWSTTSNRATLILFICAAVAVAGPQPALQPFEAVEPHMGSLFRIKLYASSEPQARSAFRSAFERVAQLDRILSDYDPQSELSRLSTVAVASPAPVSEDLFRVLSASQKLAEDTGGAFDVTLGPVIRLWREARKNAVLPSSVRLEQAGKLCGYRKLKLDFDRRTVQLENAGMQLDVGGIAKGYTADEALSTLRKLGITRALVAASGDLAFGDPPPGKPGWTIGVDSFDSADVPFTKVLELRNAAVSTSGDTEQHLDSGGKRYSHIIDPQTRMGLTRPITVTIVARRGVDSDGLATAVSVLGEARGIDFVEEKTNAAALIVVGSGDRCRALESTRFRKLAIVGKKALQNR